MHKSLSMLVLALMAVLPSWGEDIPQDSLQLLTQQGDSCMQQYNTFEALKYYRQAFDMASRQGIVHFSMDEDFSMSQPYVPEDKVPKAIRLKLADCQFKRANYHQTAELLKNMAEDSLTHEAFRQLSISYKKQGDPDSYIYWAGRLVSRYPMDGEMVAGLTLGYAQQEQPQNGIACGLKYFAVDSTNIEVNRALADAYFMDRQFDKASEMYDRLLQQGDSVFNTLYSAGMAFTRIDSLERAYDCLLKAFLISGLQHEGCAYRLGVVCVDTKRYEQGLGYLDLATELMLPDTTSMRAITLSKGEGYYLTERYAEAVDAWKEHLTYNPGSVATYYNIANAYAYLLHDKTQAEDYYRRFLDLARKEENPNKQLTQMILNAEGMIKISERRKTVNSNK